MVRIAAVCPEVNDKYLHADIIKYVSKLSINNKGSSCSLWLGCLREGCQQENDRSLDCVDIQSPTELIQSLFKNSSQDIKLSMIRLLTRRPDTMAVGIPVPGCVLAPTK